jgi:Fe(II)/alpha-ketoglutarate-dependent arginine beta-hydroxylase
MSLIMNSLVLSADEIRSIQGLLSEIPGAFTSVEDPELAVDAPLYAHELPRRVRRHLIDFRSREPESGLCVISGYPIDHAKIGSTPAHWHQKAERSPAREEEILLLLFGSLLGDCIGWATQQDGRLVHDILPIRAYEDEQLGFGSKQVLWWHTEDAFHPFRGDYLGMMCLRNPDGVATTFASLEGIELDPQQRSLLFEPWYTIRPDESHRKKNRSDLRSLDEDLDSSYSRIDAMDTAPEKVAVLYGDPRSPYVRLDPYFMEPVADNPEAQAALEVLIHAIDSKLQEIVLTPGDFCFIDNFKLVHGRKPFTARYDGTDRWLKRVNIARDLRKSRASRTVATSRIIY